MNMISLFDEDAKYIEDAEFLDVAIQKAIDPIMRKCVADGYSVRDVYTIAQMAAMDIMTEIILDNDMDMAKRNTPSKNHSSNFNDYMDAWVENIKRGKRND